MAFCRIVPTVSNGTTEVSLVAAVSGQIVYPTRLVLTNESATDDESVILLSGTTAIERYYLPAKQTIELTEFNKNTRTTAGEALQFKLASAGATVYVSGSAEQL